MRVGWRCFFGNRGKGIQYAQAISWASQRHRHQRRHVSCWYLKMRWSIYQHIWTMPTRSQLLLDKCGFAPSVHAPDSSHLCHHPGLPQRNNDIQERTPWSPKPLGIKNRNHVHKQLLASALQTGNHQIWPRRDGHGNWLPFEAPGTNPMLQYHQPPAQNLQLLGLMMAQVLRCIVMHRLGRVQPSNTNSKLAQSG